PQRVGAARIVHVMDTAASRDVVMYSIPTLRHPRVGRQARSHVLFRIRAVPPRWIVIDARHVTAGDMSRDTGTRDRARARPPASVPRARATVVCATAVTPSSVRSCRDADPEQEQETHRDCRAGSRARARLGDTGGDHRLLRADAGEHGGRAGAGGRYEV